MQRRTIEITVGAFMLIAIAALVMLAFQVSGLQSIRSNSTYDVVAYFTDIGGLKVRSRVTIAGVNIGRVKQITLDPQTYEAEVTLSLNQSVFVPSDSAATILTAGLIGDNYIALEPGADQTSLVEGSIIEDTQPAVILERLIGQFLFNVDR